MARVCVGAVICLQLALPVFAQGGPPPAVPVRVARVELKKVRETVPLIGTVEPIKESMVASDVAGRVVKIFHRRGEYLKKGDPIAELRTISLQLMVDEARSRLKMSEAKLNLTQLTFRRISRLQKSNTASSQDLDESQQALDVAQADLAVSEAQLKLLEQDLEDSTICAPFDGVIVQEFTELGEWVVKGGPVVKLIQIDEVKVVVDVPERYFRAMITGVPLCVALDALPGETFQGTITAVIPQAAEGSRTFPAEIHIANPERKIGLGMLGRVELPVGEPREMIVLPQDALIPSGRNYTAFKVVEGKAVPIDVEVAFTISGKAVVRGPLKAGDVVVVEGNERLRPGQPVSAE